MINATSNVVIQMKNRQLKRCISLLHSEAAVSVRRSNETLRSGLTAVVFVTVTDMTDAKQLLTDRCHTSHQCPTNQTRHQRRQSMHKTQYLHKSYKNSTQSSGDSKTLLTDCSTALHSRRIAVTRRSIVHFTHQLTQPHVCFLASCLLHRLVSTPSPCKGSGGLLYAAPVATNKQLRFIATHDIAVR